MCLSEQMFGFESPLHHVLTLSSWVPSSPVPQCPPLRSGMGRRQGAAGEVHTENRVNSERGTDITLNITYHPEEYIMPLFTMHAGFPLCIKMHNASIMTDLGKRL